MTAKKSTTTSRKTKKKALSQEDALVKHYKRPARSRARDECEYNKKIHQKPTNEWEKRPNQSDVIGIDVPTEVDARGKMHVSTKMPDFCLAGIARDPELEKKLKGRKLNPIYDPDYNPNE